MKGSERAIFSGVAVFLLAVGFYMLVLSPKRAEVSRLNGEVADLKSSVSEQEQLVSFGEQARRQFPRDYGHLVVLGKAVPDEADTGSLLVQLNSIAGRTDVDFRGIALTQGATGSGTSTTAATAAPASSTSTSTGTETSTDSTSTTPATSGDSATASTDSSSTTSTTTSSTTTAPAPATEADAASLPIGAVVGTAGLPTLPYDLTFTGGFFKIADYIGQLDNLVRFQDRSGQVEVNGRLMTIDGFSLKGGAPGANPTLDASFLLTSYVTPSTQGLTAGASPVGPSPAGVPAAATASTVSP